MNTQSTTEQHVRAAAPWGNLAISEQLSLPYLGDTQFAALVLERGIAHTAEAHWPTSARSLDAVLPHALTTARSQRVESALLDVEPLFGERCLALVSLRGGTASVRVAAPELVALPEIEGWLRDCFPPAEASADRLVPISFWSYGSCGATTISRTIAAPTWEEIRDNYPHALRERLAPLVDPSFRPAEGGRLVLWHGPPGTGKTYALRALAWEWRAWCATFTTMALHVLRHRVIVERGSPDIGHTGGC